MHDSCYLSRSPVNAYSSGFFSWRTVVRGQVVAEVGAESCLSLLRLAARVVERRADGEQRVEQIEERHRVHVGERLQELIERRVGLVQLGREVAQLPIGALQDLNQLIQKSIEPAELVDRLLRHRCVRSDHDSECRTQEHSRDQHRVEQPVSSAHLAPP